jgi:hypothetical protein
MTTDTLFESVANAGVPQSADQRLSARQACGPDITCRLLGTGVLDCSALRVQNLSTGGISILLDRVVPSGKLVTVEVQNTLRRSSFQWQMRVIYTMQLPGGGLMMGGAFCPTLDEHLLANVL